MELFNSGVWANSLWWQKVGGHDTASNFLWDFYALADDTSATAAQAFEYDSFQFIGGYNYMFGSQCNLAAAKWDLWDELDGKWVHSSAPCAKFAPNVWHHIQWYIQSNSKDHSYTFVTLVVDGTEYSLNQTYSAKNLGWSSNIGVQYQLDVNATGTGFHEWIDQSTLTIW
jgi:hypothetical protein